MRCMGADTDTLHDSEPITMKLTPMQCAQCNRPLTHTNAFCAHCDEEYAHQAAVEAGQKGQYTCPACAKFFDKPSTAPSLAKQVPWYQPCTPIGCPHCSTLLAFKPAVPANQLLPILGVIAVTGTFFFLQWSLKNLPDLFSHFWLQGGLVLLALLGFSNLLIVDRSGTWSERKAGTWVRQNESISLKQVAIFFFVYLPAFSAIGFLLVLLNKNWRKFHWIFMLMASVFATTANWILWLRDHKG
jgi:hypothetical protein